MNKEILPNNSEVEKTNAAIEAMKRGFQKAKGPSLGDVRRAMKGIVESPTAMTEAEKELAVHPAKEDFSSWLPENTAVSKPAIKAGVRRVVGKPVMKTQAELVAGAKQRLENIGALESNEEKSQKKFNEREESMQALYEEVAPTKEQIPMSKINKIPGVEIPKEVAQNKKKSKSFWGRLGALGKWFVS